MHYRIHTQALALSGAILAAVIMLLLGVGANVGVYAGAAEQMAKWHMFFSFTASGIIAGMLEAFIVTYVFLAIFSWLYNQLSQKEKQPSLRSQNSNNVL